MKRLILISLILLGLASPSWAAEKTGSVTLANTRNSFVAGTAFCWLNGVDLSSWASTDVAAPHTYKVTITDSAGKKAIGYIGAVGTGETTNNVYTSDFSAGVDGWAVDGGVIAGNIDAIGGRDDNLRLTCGTAGYNDIYRTIALTAGRYYRGTLDYYILSGNNVITRIAMMGSSWQGANAYFSGTDAWLPAARQFIAIASTFNSHIYAADAGDNYTTAANGDIFYIRNVIISWVTEPAATGVHIISTEGGTTRNWTSIDGSFNYNDASGYTYTVNSIFSSVQGATLTGVTLGNVTP